MVYRISYQIEFFTKSGVCTVEKLNHLYFISYMIVEKYGTLSWNQGDTLPRKILRSIIKMVVCTKSQRKLRIVMFIHY